MEKSKQFKGILYYCNVVDGNDFENTGNCLNNPAIRKSVVEAYTNISHSSLGDVTYESLLRVYCNLQDPSMVLKL